VQLVVVSSIKIDFISIQIVVFNYFSQRWLLLRLRMSVLAVSGSMAFGGGGGYMVATTAAA
jgi:hypothetical protein